jgi:hypothetical protein
MKQPLASVLLLITGLFGLAAGARAQTRQVTVKIPYEFMAGGRTLPAGTYTVSRLSDDGLARLSIVNYEQRSGVLVLAQFENRPADDTKVRFERVDDNYYLSSIVTLDGVYTLSLPRSVFLSAKSAHSNGVSASGAQ